MNSYTHIKEALQLAEQAVYQGQMNLDAANFQKAQMHLNMVQQQINEQKEAASGDKELRRMAEHLRHLREAQQAIQQNF
ncbi:hypothetical protein IHQ11_10390 [Priestia megaterium]|uniref:hypothetical protein n=1 Tax=Priestia megaterium TaxID=1404 RepID=UPI001B3A3FC7|nr:hypothetical protein [Priestia megaterium]MBQ4866902.1 hypothetical protein [Priestia megaterium]